MTNQLNLSIKQELAPLGYFAVGALLFGLLLYIITLPKNSLVDLIIFGISITLFFELPGYFFVYPLKLNSLERITIAAPISIAFNSLFLYSLNSAFLIRITVASTLLLIGATSLICFILILLNLKKRINIQTSTESI
jgi:hypothetical protein